MIVDKEEFYRFINILPKLQDDEVYFVSLSARNKYLTDEERKEYALGRTEMFSRAIIKRHEDMEFNMNRLKASLSFKTTKNKKKIPEKCLITYMNINPSSTIKAFENFSRDLSRDLSEVSTTLIRGNKPDYFPFVNIERQLMNSIQKARSRKVFVDIDVDCQDLETVRRLETNIQIGDAEYYIIKTRNGYHFLLKTDTLKRGLRIDKLIKQAHDFAELSGGEVKLNKNQMVPVPGTLQAGELVRMIGSV